VSGTHAEPKSSRAELATLRRRISYRVSLLVVIPVLVIATGGLVAFKAFFGTRDTVTALAGDLFREISRQAVGETRNEFRRAAPTADLLAQLLAEGLLSHDTNVLAKELTAVVRANSELTWVSYSDKDGSFTGAFHGGGKFRVNQSAIKDGKTELFEHDVGDDGAWTLHRHLEDSKYDPRTRPFWLLAAKERRRVWAPPYVFFEEGVPGITCAVPTVSRAGELLGVVTIDFDLNSLSELVAEIKLSKRGKVFIFTPDGTVIAHPTVRVVGETGKGAEGKLVTTKEIDDPVVGAYFAAVLAQKLDSSAEGAAPAEGSEVTKNFRFAEGGEAYVASYTTFAIDKNLRWVVGAYAPESDFMESLHRNNVSALIISIIALAAAMLLAFLLSNRIATPLSRLASEMDEVGRFELDDKPMDQSIFREIALMNGALFRMKRGLRSFASYVPRDLVRAMLASGQEAKLGGRIRELTIFFSDIAGFTTIAEGMKPDALVKFLGGYLEEMTGVIGAHHGTVDKFLGDGIMAFWGAPEDEPNHAALACEAALRCRARLAELGARDEGEWARALATRIGIATGEVLVGNIGTKERMNYTVMGDTANLAARLEGLNKEYGTSALVSEATWLAARDRVIARPIDVVAVKGKARGIKVYELLSLADAATDDERAIAAACERALDAYLARDFDGAVRAWNDGLAKRPGDRAMTAMRDRAARFASAPPPAEWSGIYVMESK
jgi:adenylate cyclase